MAKATKEKLNRKRRRHLKTRSYQKKSRAAKRRGKKKAKDIDIVAEEVVEDDSVRQESEPELVDDDEESINEQSDLSSRHVANVPQQVETHKEMMRDLLLIFSKKVEVAFKKSDDREEKLTGRWCKTCKYVTLVAEALRGCQATRYDETGLSASLVPAGLAGRRRQHNTNHLEL
ncbi:hypothetical protein JOM56_012862 [Amanita muscaria]